MRSRHQLFFFGALTSAFATAGACGGTAVVDGVNETGGGGTGTGTTSTSSTTTTTTTSTTSTNVGGGPSEICVAACETISPCNGPSNCAAQCTAGSAGCVSEQEDFLACMMRSEVDICTWPPFACSDQMFDYVACRSASPVPGGDCFSSNNDCGCTIYDGQDHAHESYCSDIQNGGYCDCLTDGNYVGTCWQAGQAECDPYSNCCAQLIFTSSPP